MDIKGNIKTKKDEMGKACYEMMKTQYTKDYSEFLNIFFGIHVSVLTSVVEKDKQLTGNGEDLNYLSLRPEPYMLIHLPIPSKEEVNIRNTDKNVTLFDCFNKQCESEILEGDNAWFNEKENKKQNFNDTQVTEILVNDNIISGNTPYCLFYRKKKIT
jgi:ubiquitin C-terminal hydrolase